MKRDIVRILTCTEMGVRVATDLSKEVPVRLLFSSNENACDGVSLHKLGEMTRGLTPHQFPLDQKALPFDKDILFTVVIGWPRLVQHDEKDLVLGFHPSWLPRGRGRAPIPWTILHGLRRSAFSLFDIGQELTGVADSGPLVYQARFAFPRDADAHFLYEYMVEQLPSALKCLYDAKPKNWRRVVQDESMATYWPKRVPRDGQIDWSADRDSVLRLIRAVTHPYPGAYAILFTDTSKHVTFWNAWKTDVPLASVVQARINPRPGLYYIDEKLGVVDVFCGDLKVIAAPLVDDVQAAQIGSDVFGFFA